jgi:hypothetical protein
MLEKHWHFAAEKGIRSVQSEEVRDMIMLLLTVVYYCVGSLHLWFVQKVLVENSVQHLLIFPLCVCNFAVHMFSMNG